MSGPEHVASRPTWRCRICGDPWPCEPAKDGLRGEYATDRTATAMWLANRWQQACDELSDPHDEMYARFVGWLRDRTPS